MCKEAVFWSGYGPTYHKLTMVWTFRLTWYWISAFYSPGLRFLGVGLGDKSKLKGFQNEHGNIEKDSLTTIWYFSSKDFYQHLPFACY